jgi:exodeoxyribonuclease VII small subunit
MGKESSFIDMSYDEAIKRIEVIVAELEQTKAISMDDYLAKAKEAKDLLTFCQKMLLDWEKKMESIVTPEEA